jgi:hypothetical protein
MVSRHTNYSPLKTENLGNFWDDMNGVPIRIRTRVSESEVLNTRVRYSVHEIHMNTKFNVVKCDSKRSQSYWECW